MHMSNKHEKQPAGAAADAASGIAIGSAASGAADGSEALSENSLDAVTGGTGHNTPKEFHLNIKNKSLDVIIDPESKAFQAVVENPRSDSGNGGS